LIRTRKCIKCGRIFDSSCNKSGPNYKTIEFSNCGECKKKWSKWSEWTGCANISDCFIKFNNRSRECIGIGNDSNHDCICDTFKSSLLDGWTQWICGSDIKECPGSTDFNTNNCEKVNGQWASWLTWSKCSMSCGMGFRLINNKLFSFFLFFN
jgi:hypothetical protein